MTQASLSYLDHRLASLLALLVSLLARPNEVVLETVGRYAVGLTTDQVLALVGRDVAHGAESIGVSSTHLLDRVLGHDVELASQVVGVELRQIVVEGQVVAGNAATHYRSVGREERSDVGGVRTQVETTGNGHPLVEVSGNLLRGGAERIYIRGNYLTGSPTKEYGLNIVPLTRQRVNVVLIPQLLQNLVLLREERRKVDQDGHRLALNLPATYADTNTHLVDALAPCTQQRGILLELGIGALVLQIGTNQDIVVTELAKCALGFRSNNGVDTTNLVANLPAYFKQVVGSHLRVIHISL